MHVAYIVALFLRNRKKNITNWWCARDCDLFWKLKVFINCKWINLKKQKICYDTYLSVNAILLDFIRFHNFYQHVKMKQTYLINH